MARFFRGSLFRHYAAYLASLLALALLASGGWSLYFTYADTRRLVDDLQREKARGAAMRIAQFLGTVQQQVRATLPVVADPADDLEERYVDLLKLLRVAPAITDAAWIDETRHERVRVSRVTRDAPSIDVDRSSDPRLEHAASEGVWFGSVYFRRDSTPYLTIVVAGPQRVHGFIVVEVNLTFVAEVVAGIHVGRSGYAYVVDSEGRLLAHPDLSKVLRKVNLSELRQVLTAVGNVRADEDAPTVFGHDDQGRRSIAAYARIQPLGWNVLVEQPLAEAFAPIYGHVRRSVLLLLLGLLLAVAASLLLARRLVEPIRTLEAGAKRIAEGDLKHTVVVRTGDEIEELARQFNRMAQSLSESYAGLEGKIAERTRELAAANDAKSLFLAAASHDLRQPIHALGFYIAQLHSMYKGGAEEPLIAKIASSHAAVSNLLDQLLDLSQLDTGAVKARPERFDLRLLLTRVSQAVAPAAAARELRLRVRYGAWTVFTDPVLLERIVLNLTTNAVRYTTSGGVLIGCRKRGDRLRIDVWDTGRGIADDEKQRIFEAFYRIPERTDHGSRGLGLGLAIVSRLARLLALEVEVRSAMGRGSCFSVTVPLAEATRQTDESPSMLPSSSMLQRAFVLLVDDEPTAREAAHGLLRQWGCHVLTAKSGSDAQALLEREARAPDAIVSDYQLGAGERGTDVIAMLRARWGTSVPAILLTGDLSAAVQAEAQAAGLQLLRKPVQPAKLRVVLQHALTAAAEEQTVASVGAVAGG